MNTILNLYIRKENLEVWKAPWKNLMKLEIFGGNWRFLSPLENFLKFKDFYQKFPIFNPPGKFSLVKRLLNEKT